MKFRLKLSGLLFTCGVGVSLQPLADGLEPQLFWDAIETANAEVENDLAEFGTAGKTDVALADDGGLTCEAAKRHALEIAPELLSLADWPLDNHEPAECLTVRHASATAIDDTLLEVIEIADIPPVISVMATVSGDDAHVAKGSSTQPSLAAHNPHPLGQQLTAVDGDSLDEIRGGFELEGSGLKFSLGIERAVYINGSLVATTVLVPKDLQQATGGGGSEASVLPAGSSGTLGIIQNGTGNSVSTQISPNVAGTIIQNTLNDQKIQNVTTINASVNSLQTMRAMSLQNAIQTGIVGSLRR